MQNERPNKTYGHNNEIHCFSSLRKATEHAGGRLVSLFIMTSSVLTVQSQAVEFSARGTVGKKLRMVITSE